MIGYVCKDPEFEFALGDKVKDIITGFEGIVTARHQWLNNCNTYSVRPTVLKDGAPQDACGFDEPQLSLVQEKVTESNRTTGGPERKVFQPNR
jgi:hypothetical protein